MTPTGFPHSDIPGSKLVCSSPRLIAAYCVLHRLLAPRHSPYALSSLIIGIRNSRWPVQHAGPVRVNFSSHPHSNTARVFVDRKNYRLQDIQLSKITRGAVPLELPHAVARGDPLIPTPLPRLARVSLARAEFNRTQLIRVRPVRSP